MARLMPERPEATPDDPAAVLLKEFEALQEDLSSLRRKRTTGVFGGGAARYSPW